MPNMTLRIHRRFFKFTLLRAIRGSPHAAGSDFVEEGSSVWGEDVVGEKSVSKRPTLRALVSSDRKPY
jgi:hypothetical protein